ncbi:MAG: hypothetical protein ACK52I_11715 [Pseudomonadota bacterium]
MSPPRCVVASPPPRPIDLGPARSTSSAGSCCAFVTRSDDAFAAALPSACRVPRRRRAFAGARARRRRRPPGAWRDALPWSCRRRLGPIDLGSGRFDFVCVVVTRSDGRSPRLCSRRVRCRCAGERCGGSSSSSPAAAGRLARCCALAVSPPPRPDRAGPGLLGVFAGPLGRRQHAERRGVPARPCRRLGGCLGAVERCWCSSSSAAAAAAHLARCWAPGHVAAAAT